MKPSRRNLQNAQARAEARADGPKPSKYAQKQAAAVARMNAKERQS